MCYDAIYFVKVLFMLQFENYFPLGIAKGDTFIGREDDTLWLQKNIAAGIHTLLLAPRRYGKSSLVLHTLTTSKLAFIELDLQLCRTTKSIEKKILHSIEHLIATVIKEKEDILYIAKSFFKKAKKQWKIGLKGFVELTIEPEHDSDTADNILTALQFLDAALSKVNKKAIIFMDEIQEIIPLESSIEIQSAIRHFAQKTKHLVFIFSGSNRRMLRYMFSNNSMPLYQLCDNITLGKISEIAYTHYLRKISKITWNAIIPDEAITEIIRLSQRHPRRLYNLCLYLWRLVDGKKTIIKVTQVQHAWQKLIAAEAKGIRYFLSTRNTSQLKVLAYIALRNTTDLTSKETQIATNLSATAILKALQKLEEEDLIERSENATYNIIDPIVKETIVNYERELIES